MISAILYASGLSERWPLALQSGDDALGIVWLIVVLVICVFVLAGVWNVYAKAGQPGWACIIPIYNVVVFLRIARRPAWWTILYFIPLVSIVISIVVCIDVAKNFGKGDRIWARSCCFGGHLLPGFSALAARSTTRFNITRDS